MDKYKIGEKYKVGVVVIELCSTQSMRVSLESIRNGTGGLDAHRSKMLERVPNSGNWARFKLNHLEMKDLAYLTAMTGHVFAILRGKSEDILFHGKSTKCAFDDVLVDMLMSRKLRIFGHSHPGEDSPTPSTQDRDTLKEIGQSESKLISGRTGYEITFGANMFEDFL